MLTRSFVKLDGSRDIEGELIGNIIQVTNLFYSIINKTTALNNLSKSQFDVIAFINYFSHQGPITLTEISNVMHLSKANVSGILSRLEERQIIFFQKSDMDGRVREILLTQKGKSIIQELSPFYEKCLNSVFSKLSESEKKQMVIMLTKIADGFNECLKFCEFKPSDMSSVEEFKS